MSSINITIKREAYEFLKRRKTKSKSFSDVILEMKEKTSPLDFFGGLKEKDWKTAENKMHSFRRSFTERLRK